MTTLALADNPSPTASPSILDKVLKTGGVVGLIALLLILWLTQSFASGQDDIAQIQQNTLSAVQQHTSDSHNEQRLTRQLLFAICLNSAKSDDARRLCEVGR